MLEISRTVIGLFFLSQLLLGCATNSENTTTPTVNADDVKSPSGTLVIDHTQVMLILGGGRGSGTLQFNGQSYPFKTSGLRLGGAGIHKISVEGTIYALNDVKDFPGTYFAAQAGITIVKGKSGIWVKNTKGVTLYLKSTDASGLALSMGVGGVKIALE